MSISACEERLLNDRLKAGTGVQSSPTFVTYPGKDHVPYSELLCSGSRFELSDTDVSSIDIQSYEHSHLQTPTEPSITEIARHFQAHEQIQGYTPFVGLN